jgi:hypothetical protein
MPVKEFDSGLCEYLINWWTSGLMAPSAPYGGSSNSRLLG